MRHTALARTVLVVVALHQGLCLAQSDDGESPDASDWLSKQYGYVANNESLRSLLYDFGTTLGIPVIVSTKINAVADDRIPVMSAEDFLAEIHKRFGLVWVHDGTTLYCTTARSGPGNPGLPLCPARRLQGCPGRRRHRGGAAEPALSSGREQSADLRPSTIRRVGEGGCAGAHCAEPEEHLAQDLDENVAPAPGDAMPPREDLDYAIRIFEVRYGYVDEMANNASGGKAPIVSLAEMVAKLMNVAHVSSVTGINRSAGVGVPKLKGTGVVPGDAAGHPAPVALPGIVGTRGAGQEAFVIGDPRLNAVIVRDRKHRMPAYERLITELDSPVDQIEITVSVLDIDASAAEELRFELESDSLRLDAGADDGSTIALSTNLWDVDGIALRVRALRSSGKSRILTSPSVTTLDNHEASFQNNRTFYVRLGGNDAESVDLAPVSYGWVVRIRPHVIYDGDDKRIQLAIHIEDGNRGGVGLEVTGVPEVSQNVIQTQAVVPEGSSLLIGGYTVREQTRFEQRVPGLGRIPLLGWLFSTKVDRDQSVARYFLITPRILSATISYEINTGFEGEPLDEVDAVTEVQAAVDPERIAAKHPLLIGMDKVDAIRAAHAAAKPADPRQ